MYLEINDSDIYDSETRQSKIDDSNLSKKAEIDDVNATMEANNVSKKNEKTILDVEIPIEIEANTNSAKGIYFLFFL